MQQDWEPFLAGDPADKDHIGPPRVNAVTIQHVGVQVRGVLAGVDAVADDVDAVRRNRRVGGQHIGPHSLGNRHHRRSRFGRNPLAPAGQCVTTAELLCLPRPQRLQ
jgi:hypothetical protein